MNTRNNFLVLLAMASLGLSACAALPEGLVQTPNVRLSNVQVVGLGLSEQTFLLSFDVSNPNPFSLPVKSVGYGLKLDGQRFATGETDSNFTVPADGDSQFSISVNLNLLQTAPQLLSIVRDGARGEIPYEVEGSFGVDIPLAPVVRYQNEGTVQLKPDSSAASFLQY